MSLWPASSFCAMAVAAATSPLASFGLGEVESRQSVRFCFAARRLRLPLCRIRSGAKDAPADPRPSHIPIFADGVFQAGRISFKLQKLLIKVLRKDISLPQYRARRLPILPRPLSAGRVRADARRAATASGLHSPEFYTQEFQYPMVRASMALIRHSNGQRNSVGAKAEIKRARREFL